MTKDDLAFHVIDGVEYPSFTDNTWIGDTGSSCHIVHDDTGLYDITPISEVVGGIGGQSIRATKMGRLNVVIKQADGTLVRRVLYLVKYCLGATERIWSLNQELNDARLSTDDKHRYVLTYNDDQQTKIVFDRRAKINNGWVPGVEVIQDTAAVSYTHLTLPTN